MPFVLPQSPRWLLVHGHRDKAIQELKRLDFSAVEAEKDLLGPAAEQRMAIRQPGAVEGLTMLFRKPYRRPALLALYVLGVIQLSGIDGECSQSLYLCVVLIDFVQVYCTTPRLYFPRQVSTRRLAHSWHQAFRQFLYLQSVFPLFSLQTESLAAAVSS